MTLYTLNGALLLEQAACDSADDSVLTCVFYESVNNEWLERDLLFTGHKRGVVNVSHCFSIRFPQFCRLTISRSGPRQSAADDLNWISSGNFIIQTVAETMELISRLGLAVFSHFLLWCIRGMKQGVW